MNLRSYEALYIVDPKLADADIEQVIQRLNKVVTDAGGEISRSEIWERRRLAYEVAGRREGIYCIMYIDAPAEVPKELYRQFVIMEPVLRGRVYMRAKEKEKVAK